MLIDASYNTLTGQILSAAIEVHRTLGPGLLESTYMPCLLYELTARKLRFVTQRSVPIVYKGMRLDAGYRLDLIVEGAVVVEVKSVPTVLARVSEILCVGHSMRSIDAPDAQTEAHGRS